MDRTGSTGRDDSAKDLTREASRDPEAAVLARNRITRTTFSRYEVDGYRYTNLADALAQVSRGASGRDTAR